MVTVDDVQELVEERPRKFSPEEIGYQEAPEGSAMTCVNCFRYFQRVRDGFSLCEIMRSDETDVEGVKPNWRCHFYTTDGTVFPFSEEE